MARRLDLNGSDEDGRDNTTDLTQSSYLAPNAVITGSGDKITRISFKITGVDASDDALKFASSFKDKSEFKITHRDMTWTLERIKSTGSNDAYQDALRHIVITDAGSSKQSSIAVTLVAGPQETTQTDTVVCFCEGTRIATQDGWREVQDLRVGDLVRTSDGEHRPVRWLGHRRIAIDQHAQPKLVRPVRVSAGAFGEGLPVRDLSMSPGHCIFAEGTLIPIRSLINGATVVQVPVAAVCYWHVELDSHAVILAEGLPAESYLDTGNRSFFGGETGASALDPLMETEKPAAVAAKCAPVKNEGPEVTKVRSRLAENALRLGHGTTPAHDLHIVADGRRIEPIALDEKQIAFALPAESETVALMSRTFTPCHVRAASIDARELGVAVNRLQVDGREVDLRGPLPAACWHAVEVKGGLAKRWTKGAVTLPAKTRIVIVDLAGEGFYWAGQHPAPRPSLRLVA